MLNSTLFVANKPLSHHYWCDNGAYLVVLQAGEAHPLLFLTRSVGG